MVCSPMHEFVENKVWFEVKGKSYKSKRLSRMRSTTSYGSVASCISGTLSREDREQSKWGH